MTPRAIFAAVAVLCGILAYAYFGSGTVRAQDAPAAPECVTLEDLVAAVEAAGDQIVGGALYDGETTDTAVFVRAQEAGLILMFGFKNGCLVSGPIGVDKLASITPTGNLSGRVGNETFA